MRVRKSGSYGVQGALFKTSLGWAGVAVSEQGIRRIVLPKKTKKGVNEELSAGKKEVRSSGNSNRIRLIAELLRKYFSGKNVSFKSVPLDIHDSTSFQRAVWRAAAAIPYGKTQSYAWIAKKIKNPKAARAVGQALGANPIPIIIPCHRVIASAGTLGGFSSGLSLKQGLLDLESRAKSRTRGATKSKKSRS